MSHMENNIDKSEAVSKVPNNVSTPTTKNKIKIVAKDAWDLVKFAAIALAIVIPVRMYIGQPFVVSGTSMVPTFLDGQYLIVDEISYTIKGAHRGDVVIFKYPGDTSRYFIKRIIGLPNEKVEINDGVVKIINKENPDGFILNEPYINEKFHTTEKYETSKDEYFVMGDNRNMSADSRVWGILPKKLMIGRAFLRLLPFDHISYLPGAFKETK